MQDRVKQALKQEIEENNGHKRKRKSSVLNAKEIQLDGKIEKNKDDNIKEEDKNNKPKSERKTCPPPLEFAELLKLAEKKQYEPVIIEIKPKLDEERPMTKRQKKEWEYMQGKQKREQEKVNLQITKKSNNMNTSCESSKLQSNKIPKKSNLNSIQNNNNSLKDIVSISKKSIDKSNEKRDTHKVQSTSKDDLLEERKKLEVERKQLEKLRRTIEEEKRKLAQTKNKQTNAKSESSDTILAKSKSIDKQISSKNIKSRLVSCEDLKSSSLLSNNKSKQLISLDIKPLKSKCIAKKPSTSHKKRKFIYNTIYV